MSWPVAKEEVKFSVRRSLRRTELTFAEVEIGFGVDVAVAVAVAVADFFGVGSYEKIRICTNWLLVPSTFFFDQASSSLPTAG